MAGCVGVVKVPEHFSLAGTAGAGVMGRRDPCARVEPFVVGRATRTPEGPATGWYRYRPTDRTVTVEAWGPGAGWLVDHAGDLLGAHDDRRGFTDLVADHGLLARLHRERPGLRMGRSLAVVEAALVTVCGQKVTGLEARRSWAGIVRRWGGEAPGPGGLRLPPEPEALAGAAYHDLHRLGLERRRADTLLAVARRASMLAKLTPRDLDRASLVLRSIPGIGVWSDAEVRRLALGDADAVSFGDYHVPHLVSWALARERRGSDERMAELLARFAPQRGRVVRLLEVNGLGPPRRGPRMPPSGMHRR